MLNDSPDGAGEAMTTETITDREFWGRQFSDGSITGWTRVQCRRCGDLAKRLAAMRAKTLSD